MTILPLLLRLMNDNGNVKTVSRITNRSAANTVITNDNFYFSRWCKKKSTKAEKGFFPYRYLCFYFLIHCVLKSKLSQFMKYFNLFLTNTSVHVLMDIMLIYFFLYIHLSFFCSIMIMCIRNKHNVMFSFSVITLDYGCHKNNDFSSHSL